jgi:hypothetical protein
MLDLPTFLAEECRNVQRVLDESLRHSYRTTSDEFYKECQFRLGLIKTNAQDTSDPSELHGISLELSQLAALIAGIERSHLGEFSWPFADEIEKLARYCCSKQRSTVPTDAPLFFMSSSGELDAYSIVEDANEPIFVGRPIFNVVFPRSLRYHVLLHAILGHEIGHAAYCVTAVRRDLESKVTNKLIEGSPLSDASTFMTWLAMHFGDVLPADTDDALEVADKIIQHWKQELLCDLFGLLCIGPSFLPAQRSVLNSLDPFGTLFFETHPPHLSRFWMLDTASKAIGLSDEMRYTDRKLSRGVSRLSRAMSRPLIGMRSEFKLLNEKNIGTATRRLQSFLRARGNSLYVLPTEEALRTCVNSLSRLQPVPASTMDGGPDPLANQVDFRTILLAGWLAWFDGQKQSPSIEFFDMNRLCEISILHQQAVSVWNEGALR